MHKKFKYVITILAVVFFVTLFVIPQHESLQAATTLEVSSADIARKGFRKAVQTALNVARSNATEENPYIIKVPGGNYTQDAYLYLCSNTTLDLSGSVITRSKSTNMIRIGASENSKGNPYAGYVGYFYRNVSIVGGSFNGAGYNATIIKATHCYNFSMTNTTVYETKNGHLVEIGGVNKVNISDCTFYNQFISATNEAKAYEAIQFDILSTEHMSGTRSEALPTKDVTITNCIFSEVPRGIGSHTAILNAPLDTIEISNCTFENTKSCAIQSLNWVNVSIHDNKINNTPRGIAIYFAVDGGQGTYLPSVLASEGGIPSIYSDEYIPNNKQNIEIYNNSIFLFDIKDPYSSFVKVGILASGCNVTEVKKPKNTADKSGYLPVGNYYVSAVSIHDNNINTYGNGIRIRDGVNCTVTNNTINCNKSTHADNTDAGNGGKSTYGIQARDRCAGINITNNEVNDANSNGIYVSANSSCNNITDNVITRPGKNGIDVEKSSCDNILRNSITDSKGAGIFVYDQATANLIDTNTITSPKAIGIHITEQTTVQTVSNNSIETSGIMGISVSNSATAATIRTNTITKAGDDGIKLTSNGNATTITGNTIASPKLNGIYANYSSSVDTISSNTITNAKKNGIDIEHSKANTITGNTIRGSKVTGIFVYDKGKVTNITKNTISKSGNQGISINTKGYAKKITSNKISNSKAFAIIVGDNSKVTEVNKNKCSKNKSGNVFVGPDSSIKMNKQK